MSTLGWFKERAKEHLPAVATPKHARKRLVVICAMGFAAASFSVDLKTGDFNAVRCGLLLTCGLFAWRLLAKANRHGRVLAAIGVGMAFVLSGSPSSMGGTNGEQAWAAMSASTDILNGLLGDRLRAVAAVASAWLRAHGIA